MDTDHAGLIDAKVELPPATPAAPTVFRGRPLTGPAAVRRYTKTAFVAAAHAQVTGRKVDKTRWLADFYETACDSVGLPVADTSETIRMFRVVLEEYRALCQLRKVVSAVRSSIG